MAGRTETIERLIAGCLLREAVGFCFSPDEVKKRMKQDFSVLKKEHLRFPKVPRIIQAEMSVRRDQLGGDGVSRNLFVADYVTDRFFGFILTAPEWKIWEIFRNRPKDFAFFYDVDYGAVRVLDTLISAQNEKDNLADRIRVQTENGLANYGITTCPVECAEEHLRSKRERMRAASILTNEGPEAVLQDYLQQMKKHPVEFYTPAQVPEFVLGGAELSIQVFKKVLGLTQSLPSSSLPAVS